MNPRQLAPKPGLQLSFHAAMVAAGALVGHLCSRGRDGELLAGTALLLALSIGPVWLS
jgi:hypothetical protein